MHSSVYVPTRSIEVSPWLTIGTNFPHMPSMAFACCLRTLLMVDMTPPLLLLGSVAAAALLAVQSTHRCDLLFLTDVLRKGALCQLLHNARGLYNFLSFWLALQHGTCLPGHPGCRWEGDVSRRHRLGSRKHCILFPS